MSSGLSDTFGFTSQGVNPSSSFLSVANPTPSHFDVSTDDDHGSRFHTGTSFSRSFATSTGFVPSGSSSHMAFATSTPTPTDAAGSVTDIPGLHTFIGLNSTLNASLSLLLIGLMFASMYVGCDARSLLYAVLTVLELHSSFGAVGTKALMYFRHSRRDRMTTWLTVSHILSSGAIRTYQA
ncbi:hypothetical protein C8Q77DRAFT_1123023 [Trametes polyzona]|nr:hypothetical protein C8Q77DRAFT_1123023 [Trametes polyzona]